MCKRCCAKKAKGASWLLFSTFLFPFLHLCAKIYNFPLEKALNEERRMAYEERIYFVRFIFSFHVRDLFGLRM